MPKFFIVSHSFDSEEKTTEKKEKTEKKIYAKKADCDLHVLKG